MLNLALAEYNLETGKFERFLALGRDFYYGGNSIALNSDLVLHASRLGNKSISCHNNPIIVEYFDTKMNHELDEKDPLNRFNGLFNGRTYGNGRFVLIRSFEHTKKLAWEDDFIIYDSIIKLTRFDEEADQNCGCCGCVVGFDDERFTNEIAGNLHENPELWEKICSS